MCASSDAATKPVVKSQAANVVIHSGIAVPLWIGELNNGLALRACEQKRLIRDAVWSATVTPRSSALNFSISFRKNENYQISPRLKSI
jgi:hypothetical protein